MKLGPDPVFDEEFELDDIPPDVFTVTVTVFNKVNLVFHCICCAIVQDTVCTVHNKNVKYLLYNIEIRKQTKIHLEIYRVIRSTSMHLKFSYLGLSIPTFNFGGCIFFTFLSRRLRIHNFEKPIEQRMQF